MNTAASARSIEAVNAILQTANQAAIETAEKLMKVSIEMAVGAECGKGAAIDCSA
ncbi:MAG: hypothetical protein JW913_15760 [Chitinispirillaceae bacterium]|nr:hypothetical protein [Chitinispirillaceae bacterium]